MNEKLMLSSEHIDDNDDPQSDILSNIQNNESWEEHLEKAKSLIADSNKQKSTTSSWGVHVFDDDFNPDVELSPNDLLAHDIDSFGRKKERLQIERIQERFERELMKDMTDIDELELMANAGVEGLSLKDVQYDGKSVKIISTTGQPLKFLKSVISNSDIAENPEKFKRDDTEYRKLKAMEKGDYHFLTGEDGNFLANTICTTYIDTDINPEQAWGGATDVTYIFTKIRPNSVIDAGPGDVFSDASDGDRLSKLDKDMTPERVARESRGDIYSYNEITLKRYDETGKPLLPTALLANEQDTPENNEKMLKVAAFYGIPIVQVMRPSYSEFSTFSNANSDT